jgi:ATP-dependent 26S proteasome regulatory subunit
MPVVHARPSFVRDGEHPLLPSQAKTLEQLEHALAAQHAAVLFGREGMGTTRVLRELHERIGGSFLTSRAFVEASEGQHPLAIEETTYRVLRDELEKHPAVIVDDFQFISYLSCCSHSYPRQQFLGGALLPLIELAQESGKRIVFSSGGMPISGLDERVPLIHVPTFTPEDYASLCSAHLGADRARALDIRKVHRFAPNLSARQLQSAAEALRDDPALDTERFITHLREHHMVSNVDLGEVQAVNLEDLKGLGDVLAALEANVILPLENSEVADELDLAPKRGVLLAGPPGTGKTTIGRALAHRLKSKFFLIDGTVVSGTSDFFRHIHHVFEAAKKNAPAIIFVDDSDVIFEAGRETGFYRYLLTMLDGLESTSAGRICLMMTAMDVGSLPPALVRSGRIELWLETRMPDQEARAAILADRCAKMPASIGAIDVAQLAAASDGLSGADLKRVVDDGKLLFAYERTRGAQLLPATDYFVRAIATVRRNKEQYAAAEARARARHPERPPYFDDFGAGMAMVEAGDSMGAMFVKSHVMAEIVESTGA